MLGRLYEDQDCSAARALELVGERWTLLILRDAMFRGYTRFSEFQSALAIAPNILAKRLGTLVEAGIFHTRAASPRSDHQQYLLTEMGQGLRTVIVALTRWGDRWVRPGPVEFVHDDCDREIEHEFQCTKCGRLAPVDVHVRRRSERTK